METHAWTQYNSGPSVVRLRPRNAVVATEARRLSEGQRSALASARGIAQGYASEYCDLMYLV